MCWRAASAWYQYEVIRNAITWLEYEPNSWLQSDFSCLLVVPLGRLGTCVLMLWMQLVKFRWVVGHDHRLRRGSGQPGSWPPRTSSG